MNHCLSFYVRSAMGKYQSGVSIVAGVVIHRNGRRWRRPIFQNAHCAVMETVLVSLMSKEFAMCVGSLIRESLFKAMQNNKCDAFRPPHQDGARTGRGLPVKRMSKYKPVSMSNVGLRIDFLYNLVWC
jgi:hypothetical protein